MSTKFDLSTLGLSADTHSITVKARASGYEDSDESNAVSYVVESEAEGSKGLAYTLSDDGTYYICSGIGTCTDTDIVIASEYEGKPVKEIGANAFSDKNITSVEILYSVEIIGESAFAQCDSLTSVVISDSVSFIGWRAFADCDSLTSVEIPNSVTFIDEWAFGNCDSLTSFTIPDSVTSISKSMFQACDNLTSVVIGNGVTSIGRQAFYRCINLAEIRYNGTIAQWNSISKEVDWDSNIPATYVQCTDGTVTI